jgi:hypothetical protein
VTGGGIGSDDKNATGILDFRNGIGHGPTTEGGGKTCHRRGMSETGAVIHVIGADHGPGKFLGQIIFFVGDFGRNQYADAVRTVFVDNLPETFRGERNGFIPVGFDKSAERF